MSNYLLLTYTIETTNGRRNCEAYFSNDGGNRSYISGSVIRGEMVIYIVFGEGASTNNISRDLIQLKSKGFKYDCYSSGVTVHPGNKDGTFDEIPIEKVILSIDLPGEPDPEVYMLVLRKFILELLEQLEVYA